jgi:hypothetical protein
MFPQASLRSWTVGCPQSGSDLGLPVVAFPPRRSEASALTRRHPCPHRVTPTVVPWFPGPPLSGSSWTGHVPRVPWLAHGVTSGAVASRATAADVPPPASLLRAHAPGPHPAAAFALLIQRIVAGGCQPRLGEGLARRDLCASWPTGLDPSAGCSGGALARFFPPDHGLPSVRTRAALGHTRTATSVRPLCRRGSHALRFRPAGVLATQVAPPAVDDGLPPFHRAAMAFTSAPYTRRDLPRLRICLPSVSGH